MLPDINLDPHKGMESARNANYTALSLSIYLSILRAFEFASPGPYTRLILH